MVARWHVRGILGRLVYFGLFAVGVCGWSFEPHGCQGYYNDRKRNWTCLKRNALAAHAEGSSEEDGNAVNSNQTSHETTNWETLSEIVSIKSPWLKLVGEKLRDDHGKILDYWRLEKEHSAVILTIHNGHFVFPKPSYRPGIGRATLDFPGGRIPGDVDCQNDKEINQIVHSILCRELGIRDSSAAISTIERLNGAEGGWPVNSSFNNQLLFGFLATLEPDVALDKTMLYSDKSYKTASEDAIAELLQDLSCLQCRSVLLSWLIKNKKYYSVTQ